MTRHAELEKLIREYAELQEQLCRSLLNAHPVQDPRFLSDLPKQGALKVDDSIWTFQRHGTGVSFTSKANAQVVDVHADLCTRPDRLDAWRLLRYFESRGIRTVTIGAADADALDEQSIEKALQWLCHQGALVAIDKAHGIYALGTA